MRFNTLYFEKCSTVTSLSWGGRVHCTPQHLWHAVWEFIFNIKKYDDFSILKNGYFLILNIRFFNIKYYFLILKNDFLILKYRE